MNRFSPLLPILAHRASWSLCLGPTLDCLCQLVGGELAGGQPFKVHVGFNLGMILLRGGMPLVQVNNLLVGNLQAGPPAFKFILG